MEKNQIKLAIGGMLHDIGKIIHRTADGRNHSESGYDYLKNEINIKDDDILDQIKYHHANMINDTELKKDSLAYITYIADNMASASDRRKNNTDNYGFSRDMALDSIFNILNNNSQSFTYRSKTLDLREGINYPDEDKKVFDESFYKKVLYNISDNLRGIRYEEDYLNSLLEILEQNCSFIPSSTSKGEIADISLYDHMKLTAAMGNCIYDYLEEKNENDYRKVLYLGAEEFYKEKVFLLFSLDISGIQSFIYNQYGTEDVLKNLRARSFYLEIMLENIIDELLNLLGLSRANLIYAGGGHAYVLSANTDKTKSTLINFENDLKTWLLATFDIELFCGMGYTECSGLELRNEPSGSYGDCFRRVAENISERKIKRYDSHEIRTLNNRRRGDGVRECRICHKSDDLNHNNECSICSGLMELARHILESDFFAIHTENKGIEVYKDRYLIGRRYAELKQDMGSDNASYLRSYSKNKAYTGMYMAKTLLTGDYHSANTLEELAAAGVGIERLGVLRADIDNLGKAFVSGFDEGHQTFSRAATFSRKLTQFFKLYVNDILEKGSFSLSDYGFSDNPIKRNAAIIYSGGDDVFVVGAWKDVLEFAIDLYHNFKKFTQNTLSISAGFGMYHAKYPISYMAESTGRLEKSSKNMDGKNAISLFNENITYHWDALIEDVIGEKLRIIKDFIDTTEEKGSSFLYKLMELFRNKGDKINIARLAYLLARLEPGENRTEEVLEKYKEFRRAIYNWMQNDEDSHKVVTAIYIYAYIKRERLSDRD